VALGHDASDEAGLGLGHVKMEGGGEMRPDGSDSDSS
jgi:hypothetical protein